MPLALKPEACRGCPAEKDGLGYVPGEGPEDALWVVIGQGPGEQEAYGVRPWIGPGGQRLERWLSRAGLQRPDVRLENCVRCWLVRRRGGRPIQRPDGSYIDREPTLEEAFSCRDRHWGPELGGRPLQGVMPVGVFAMRVICGGELAGERLAGTLMEVEL